MRGGGDREADVNRIAYSLKRAFRLVAEMGFSVMKDFGLTPSRHEVMVVLDSDVQRHWRQSDLRKRLGVNRTTISRFLYALESKGLVERRKVDWGDKRTRYVRLTKKGRACLRRVKAIMSDAGGGRLLTDVMWFVPPGHRARRSSRYASERFFSRRRVASPPRSPEPTRQSLERLLPPLELLREALGDEATFLYPAWRQRDVPAAPQVTE